jgi:DNA-directed RNA polymerase subunit RPC12/RpoP
MMPVQACCICGKAFTGHGNDPTPVVNDPGARCCDDCNSRVVLPMRLERLRERDKAKREGSNGGALQ